MKRAPRRARPFRLGLRPVQRLAAVLQQALRRLVSRGQTRHVFGQLAQIAFALLQDAGGIAGLVRGRLEPPIMAFTRLGQFLGFPDQQIHTHALHAGHGRHCLGLVFSLQHKHRIDQVVHREGVFAHQPTGEVVATHAAQTGGGPGSAGDRHGAESSSNMGRPTQANKGSVSGGMTRV